ncbi:MAG TPA: GTP 3',8-cyclase MoaA [Sulfurovum sp.]|nr:MAG: GTP 3',8-cyclase MoaA [Sulfurovum sp. 35-42-20]OYY57638.1 MAG: GTP 3',8-cyclase MoaA [Sulfurovum sp. 28-43-6]OYZ26290.1 MAG: GTP 3',8-cyclase MoaA [Sulfurovum sp. 16-42-52]OYZ49967.1 MAG: GTP 3',8-cyclase MoaA [Sulfurovum sp. 24-42-9]OZA46532.1 MAG: GTP 3',8-cyclase MoaA [Sulfurovum sp. 17-42-90]OZA59961.1 MAG: GTP 3',8-cyclase MoaA [Sulfurovum sp. 39-42-12]HQR73552.1 GTP 3',8-cyclase MoaA [Sulfurovum sp.]
MLIDGHGRTVNYLRISVTERCNFRCQYCMPEKPFSWVPKENLLTFEELFLFVKVAIDGGVTKIRLTGGEPLLREDLDTFIKMISDYKPDIDLALTTNAYLLPEAAQRLKDAGLKRLNISLDSLKADVAAKIAGKDVLSKVLQGIDKALEVGLKVKINMVPLKGINDGEILDLLEYCKARSIKIRFIEYMENRHADQSLKGMHGKEILEKVKEGHTIRALGREGASPSFNYALEDGTEFGLIDPHKHDFCENCNRIRLTAEGNLIPCLYFDEAMSIAESVKKGDIQGAANVLAQVLKDKPKENRWSEENPNEVKEISNRAFYETGG